MSEATQLDSATHAALTAQFEKLSSFRQGWLDGAGQIPVPRDLDWLSDQIAATFPEELAMPFVCLTPGGGVFLEWTNLDWIVSVEVPLPERRADLQATNAKTHESLDEDCRLETASDFSAVHSFVRRFV